MFHCAAWQSHSDFAFKSIFRSNKATLSYIILEPGAEKVKEDFVGTIVFHVVQGTLTVENGKRHQVTDIMVLDSTSYSCHNDTTQRCAFYIDLIKRS